jgi:hypothetical protein
MYVIFSVYFIGYLLAYAMLRVEHAAEGELYTKGDRVIGFTLALLSWGIIIYMLCVAWVKAIAAKGYWAKPVKMEKINELNKVA